MNGKRPSVEAAKTVDRLTKRQRTYSRRMNAENNHRGDLSTAAESFHPPLGFDVMVREFEEGEFHKYEALHQERQSVRKLKNQARKEMAETENQIRELQDELRASQRRFKQAVCKINKLSDEIGSLEERRRNT